MVENIHPSRKPHRWVLLRQFKGQFKFFRDLDSGRIAVADNSAYYPHETEDGILWLDTERPFRWNNTPDHQLGHVFMPLLDTDGNRCSTGPSVMEVAWCVKALGMQPPVLPWDQQYDLDAELKTISRAGTARAGV